MKPADFISKILDAARKCMLETGIPASITIAQAACESSTPDNGWGESKLAKECNNLFGIKADKSWSGESASFKTTEYINGKRVIMNAAFRKYPDWLSSIEDHARFLKSNPRYSECFKQTTGEGWARALQAAGYSTNPGYADLLISIMRSRNMIQYDRKAS